MRPLPPAPAPPHAPAAASSPSPRPSAARAGAQRLRLSRIPRSQGTAHWATHSSTHRAGRSAISERQGFTTTMLEGSRYRPGSGGAAIASPRSSRGFASVSACNSRAPLPLPVWASVTVCVRAGFLLFLSGSRSDQCSVLSFRERHRQGASTVILTCGAEQMANRSVLEKESLFLRFVFHLFF